MVTQNLSSKSSLTSTNSHSPAATLSRSRTWLLSALCWLAVSVLYVGVAYTLSRYHSFWSPDVGARFAMIHNWLVNGHLFFLSNADANVDPAGQIMPIAPYAVHLPKGVCSTYPAFFSFVSGLFYRQFGYGGLLVVPVLSGLGTLLLVQATAKRLTLGSWFLLPLIMGLATPVLIYSVVFWDHSLQMFLTALAGYWMLRSLMDGRTSSALAAGAALGAGVWVHETFLIMFAAVIFAGLSLVRIEPMRRIVGRVVLGFACPALAWVVFNQVVYGTPTGPHLLGPNNPFLPDLLHTTIDPVAIWQRTISQLIGVEEASTGVLVLGVCLIAYLLFTRYETLAPFKPYGLPLLNVAAAGAALVAISGTSWVHGLFSATPLLVPALASPLTAPRATAEHPEAVTPRDLFYTWLSRICVLFTPVVLLSGHDPGLEWGSRYLLTALPFLVLLAAKALDTQWQAVGRVWKPVVLTSSICLISVSSFSEARAVSAVKGKLIATHDLINAARNAPSSVLVTNCWWLPLQLTAGNLPQTQFLADTPDGRAVFLAAVRARRESEFTYMGDAAGLTLFTRAALHGNGTYVLKSVWNGAGMQMGRFVRQVAAVTPAPSIPRHVMALYYPWYGTPKVSGAWSHQEGVDTAKKTMSDHAHYPVIGPYDSTDVAVIDRHLQEAHDAGIDTLVCSWWGPKDLTDKSIRLLLHRAAAHSMKICILWEHLSAPGGTDGASADLNYLLGTITKHPDYLRLNGKPVVFIYAGTAQGLNPDQWSTLLSHINAQDSGGVSLIGTAQSPGDTLLWDGFYDLNTNRSLAGLSLADCMKVQSESFHVPIGLARRFGGVSVETIRPGVDDRRVSPNDSGTLVDRQDGQLYADLWKQTIKDDPDWVLISSFNQWHVGTEIEPSVEMGNRYLTLTRQYSDEFRKIPLRHPIGPTAP